MVYCGRRGIAEIADRLADAMKELLLRKGVTSIKDVRKNFRISDPPPPPLSAILACLNCNFYTCVRFGQTPLPLCQADVFYGSPSSEIK